MGEKADVFDPYAELKPDELAFDGLHEHILLRTAISHPNHRGASSSLHDHVMAITATEHATVMGQLNKVIRLHRSLSFARGPLTTSGTEHSVHLGVRRCKALPTGARMTAVPGASRQGRAGASPRHPNGRAAPAWATGGLGG